MVGRISFERVAFDLALCMAHRGTCRRRNYGAVIFDANNCLVSSGYTGAPVGFPHCTEASACWREKNNIPSGSNYEKCRSIHAEMNALVQAGSRARGCLLFLAGIDGGPLQTLIDAAPCYICMKLIVNACISRVYALQADGRSIDYCPENQLIEMEKNL